MRISSIQQIYRHGYRWGEILTVLSKYGLAGWIGRLGPEFAKDLLKAPGGSAIARLRWETRLRMAATELGPTFIKLGQILSTRPDLVGVSLAEELQQLQTAVQPDSPELVRSMVEEELQLPLEEIFAQFDPHPLASASIGQVHAAVLTSGERVVVKVQRAEIERKVRVDLDILSALAQMAERMPEFESYRPTAIAAEFQRVFQRELDFNRERRNLEHFGRLFASDTTVRVPRVFPRYCSPRVLTMERIDGIKLAETDRLRASGFDLAEVARRGANLYMEMIFGQSFYHADPHPGNVIVMDGNVIGLLDFGMVGRIDERLQEDIEEALVAIASQDAEHLTSIITRVGAAPPGLDRASLSIDVADYISFYGNQSLDDFEVGKALKDLVEIVRRYKVTLPARIAMLIKTLVTLEGTSRLLSPHFSLVEVMKPYRRKLLLRRLSPGRQWRKLRRLFAQVEHMIDVLPRGVVEIVEQVESGKFDVHLEHHGLEPSVNRLVLGMLASALFLGSSLLLAQDVPPRFDHFWLLWRIPLIREVSVPGSIGIGFSIALGVRLWRAINKSGRLDRRK